jgi:hypothetical protein
MWYGMNSLETDLKVQSEGFELPIIANAVEGLKMNSWLLAHHESHRSVSEDCHTRTNRWTAWSVGFAKAMCNICARRPITLPPIYIYLCCYAA